MLVHDDITINFLESEFIEEIEKMNDEFIEWLKDKDYYIDIFNEVSANSNEYFMKERLTMINSLKSSIMQMKTHVAKQMKSDLEWMNNFKMILMDMKHFPPKPMLVINQAPNYILALQRISNPLTSSLNGINLDKIDSDSKNPNSNLYVKQMFIPSFRGNAEFKQYAKLYYYGAEANKGPITQSGMIRLIPRMLNFCMSYPAKILSFQTELNSIASYINKNEQGQNTTVDDLAKIRANNMTKAIVKNNMASTNAINNTTNINAATEFFNTYFSDILNEDPIQKSFMKKPQQQQTQMSNNKNSNGVPVNTGILNNKKRLIVADIVKDCFNAKLAALGLIYRDFIFIMRKHVASYKGSNAGNQGQT